MDITMMKPKLFVDMDGTAAEWRNIHIDLEEYEGKYTVAEKVDEILRTPGYFYSLEPNLNVIDAIRMLHKRNEIEVFILSCCIADTKECSPQKEKALWLNKYLPEIDDAHRIFVPDGEDKKHYIPKSSSENYLLDDYTWNLRNFSEVGTAIKFLNGVNSKNKTWDGNKISCTRDAQGLADAIESIVFDKCFIRDAEPVISRLSFDYKQFNFDKAAREMKCSAESEAEPEQWER